MQHTYKYQKLFHNLNALKASTCARLRIKTVEKRTVKAKDLKVISSRFPIGVATRYRPDSRSCTVK